MKRRKIRGIQHSTWFKKQWEYDEKTEDKGYPTQHVIKKPMRLFNIKQSLMHNLCPGTLTSSGTNPRLAPLILGRRGKIGLRGTPRTKGSWDGNLIVNQKCTLGEKFEIFFIEKLLTYLVFYQWFLQRKGKFFIKSTRVLSSHDVHARFHACSQRKTQR